MKYLRLPSQGGYLLFRYHEENFKVRDGRIVFRGELHAEDGWEPERYTSVALAATPLYDSWELDSLLQIPELAECIDHTDVEHLGYRTVAEYREARDV